MEFKQGQHVVYPGHGVGLVTSIDTKEIFGKSHIFYVVKILDSGMTILVPKNGNVGLRELITQEQAKKVIDILKQKSKAIDNKTWNTKYREYMEKVKTGSIFEIAEVLRDLKNLDKELSFGERKMLDVSRILVLKELELVVPNEINQLTLEVM